MLKKTMIRDIPFQKMASWWLFGKGCLQEGGLFSMPGSGEVLLQTFSFDKGVLADVAVIAFLFHVFLRRCSLSRSLHSLSDLWMLACALLEFHRVVGGLLQSSDLVCMLASTQMSPQNVLLGEGVLANITGVPLFFDCLCDRTLLSFVGRARVAVKVFLSFLHLMRSIPFPPSGRSWGIKSV